MTLYSNVQDYYRNTGPGNAYATPNMGFGPTPTPDVKPPDPSNEFRVPMNLFPSTTSTSSNQSSGKSQSGINWQNPLNQAILPSLTSAGVGLQGKVDALGQTLQDSYANQIRRAMSPENFQGVLNTLSNRGVLDSSIAENTLAKAGNLVSRTIADKAFESNLAYWLILQVWVRNQHQQVGLLVVLHRDQKIPWRRMN